MFLHNWKWGNHDWERDSFWKKQVVFLNNNTYFKTIVHECLLTARSIRPLWELIPGQPSLGHPHSESNPQRIFKQRTQEPPNKKMRIADGYCRPKSRKLPFARWRVAKKLADRLRLERVVRHGLLWVWKRDIVVVGLSGNSYD